VPSFIGLDTQERMIFVYTSDSTLNGQIYEVKLVGTIHDSQNHTTFQEFSLTLVYLDSTKKSTNSSATTNNTSTFTTIKSSSSSSSIHTTSNQLDSALASKYSVSQSSGFTSYISSITNKGLLLIKFSEQVIVPQNYTSFNSSILNIQYIPSYENNVVLNSWQITTFTSTSFSV
jgi:hypothetical protein